MIKKEKGWVRIAGNAKKVREGSNLGWRCFLGNAEGIKPDEEIPLTHFLCSGNATQDNFIPGINPRGGEKGETVLAWIDLFGDAEIDQNDVLHITLRDPAGTAP